MLAVDLGLVDDLRLHRRVPRAGGASRAAVGSGPGPVDRATAATRVARASRCRPSEAAARRRPWPAVSGGRPSNVLASPALAIEPEQHPGLEQRAVELGVVEQRRVQPADRRPHGEQQQGLHQPRRHHPEQIGVEERRRHGDRQQDRGDRPDQRRPHRDALVEQAPPDEPAQPAGARARGSVRSRAACCRTSAASAPSRRAGGPARADARS